MLDAYRRLGADPPFGDPRRYHGVAMEGYFWRFTQAAVGRVAIVLCAVSRDRAGALWAFVGVATYPGRFFRWAALPDAVVDPRSFSVRAGEAFACGPGFVHVDVADGLPARGVAVGRRRLAAGARRARARRSSCRG